MVLIVLGYKQYLRDLCCVNERRRVIVLYVYTSLTPTQIPEIYQKDDQHLAMFYHWVLSQRYDFIHENAFSIMPKDIFGWMTFSIRRLVIEFCIINLEQCHNILLSDYMLYYSVLWIAKSGGGSNIATHTEFATTITNMFSEPEPLARTVCVLGA